MINDSSDRSRVLSKVYMQIIKVKDIHLRDQLELLIGDDLNSFYEENANSLIDPKLWNYIIKQNFAYSGISYMVCLLIKERYTEFSEEIIRLLLKYGI